MTSQDIRRSFLDFFREKQHTIVPSSSLMPDSPGLLFTNAGMNQFVPIFLNETPCSYHPARAADTQKCIRAGGKHNDLEDVGLDTYHHTFFEMLGNWSFGDYFKREAIEWAWELLVERWKFPPARLYATVYKPGQGDPADFDQEAYDIWKAIFEKNGLDPAVHIVYGNKKDNFWMMGETGPCGPCSEVHFDLTPAGDTKGALVNAGDSRCIEIWNLVFIQFNAGADGSFKPLPARHVDTGMGFERVCSILQCTQNFSDFSGTISNYDTDVFAPIFRALEKLSGKRYTSTLPKPGSSGDNEQEKVDVAFRVIADHIRTLSCSIADGIFPGNTDRNYVLRRILRRAVRYGRELGLHDLFFYKLVPVVVDHLGGTFPELAQNRATVEKVIRAEEESFSRTLDNGISKFETAILAIANCTTSGVNFDKGIWEKNSENIIPGFLAFELYDTYGFPLDLTELMARERGLTVDAAGFEKLMTKQKDRSRAAQKKDIIEVTEDEGDILPATFVGYDQTEAQVQMLNYKIDFGKTGDETIRARLFFSPTPFYAEMGGQLGDTGWIETGNGQRIEILETRKAGAHGIAHVTEDVADLEDLVFPLTAKVDVARRGLIESHHSATHLLHWALREVLGSTVSQKGSYVGPDHLRFDFSHLEGMKQEELQRVEEMVNARIAEDHPVKWEERPYADVKGDPTIIQFFGDKYGDMVRVVDIGGFSKELCGGTHVRRTSAIGPFRILSEGAVAAGVRRIECVCGPAINRHLETALAKQAEELAPLLQKSGRKLDLSGLSADPVESWVNFLANADKIEAFKAELRDSDKQQAKLRMAEMQKQAATLAPQWAAEADRSAAIPFVVVDAGEGDGVFIQTALGELKKHFEGAVLVIAQTEGKVALGASVSSAFSSRVKAGDIIREVAPKVGGKGGGKPDMAQGGGNQPENIGIAMEYARVYFKNIH